MIQFEYQARMGNFVKCFFSEKSRRIASMSWVVDAFGKIVDGQYELGFSRSLLAESMLTVRQNIVTLKVFHDATI